MEGRECLRCGRKRGILTIHTWVPPRPWNRERYPEGFYSVRARCIDGAACDARRSKRDSRARLRSSRITIVEAPGAEADRQKPGHCGWCGEPMSRVNKAGETVPDKTRAYHRAERGERDCRSEVDHSYCFKADTALRLRAKLTGEDLRCAGCDLLCVAVVDGELRDQGRWWEADHELALEDGGAHTIENLRCRCQPCHARKSARENAARRAAPRSDQLTIGS